MVQVYLLQLPLPTQICYGTLAKKSEPQAFSSGWHFLHIDFIDCWNPDLLLEMVRRPEVLLCHYALFMVSQLQRQRNVAAT